MIIERLVSFSVRLKTDLVGEFQFSRIEMKKSKFEA
jgi:hypothetical protein